MSIVALVFWAFYKILEKGGWIGLLAIIIFLALIGA